MVRLVLEAYLESKSQDLHDLMNKIVRIPGEEEAGHKDADTIAHIIITAIYSGKLDGIASIENKRDLLANHIKDEFGHVINPINQDIFIVYSLSEFLDSAGETGGGAAAAQDVINREPSEGINDTSEVTGGCGNCCGCLWSLFH